MTENIAAKGGLCDHVISTRYIFAILGSIGMGIVYGLKVNLGVAMVSMVKNTALQDNSTMTFTTPIKTLDHLVSNELASSVLPSTVQSENECIEEPGNSAATEEGPFEWSGTTQGALKSSYFWGYIVAQIPGGRIAELVSAKWVMFFSVAINVLGTLLSPIAAECHYIVFLIMRVAEGVGGGVTFPAMHVMLSNWAPPNERSVMSSIVYAGTALGTVIFTLVSGIIAANLGWKYIFYIQGAVSGLWLIFWFVFVADTPQKQTFISEQERNFICSSLHTTENLHSKAGKAPVPWKAIFASPAFLAILIAHTCSNWGWYMVLIELPNYMKNVLKLKITENAVLSAIPFLTMWIFSIILSKTLDVMRTKSIITTTTARKIATTIASLIPMICFLTISYIGCKKTVVIILMIIAITSIGGMFCGYLSNHIDIAPNFAGTLMAITNSIATIPGIIVPIFVGKLTETDNSINSWIIVFWVTIVLYLIEIIVYNLFGSGKEQEWNTYNSCEAGEVQPLKSVT